MTRPRIKIDLDIQDWIIEIMGASFLLVMIGWSLYHFNSLPDMIPRHYNALGEPDAFSQKNTLWTLPVVGTVMYIGMFFLNKYPHIFNYPTDITEENAERQYRIATKLIRALNLAISASFCYISYSTIQIALEKKEGLGTFFTPIFVVGIFAILGFYLYRSFKGSR